MAKLITKQLADRIKAVLVKYPQARNNDNILLSILWHDDIKTGITRPESAIDLLKVLAAGELTNVASVKRARRKLQEDIPNLRGIKYLKRKNMAKQIRKEIIFLHKSSK